MNDPLFPVDYGLASINRHHAYVSNHMKTKTDQHATHNTLKSVPTFPRQQQTTVPVRTSFIIL